MPGKKAIADNVSLKVPKGKINELGKKLKQDIPDADSEYPYEINKVLYAINFALQAQKLEKLSIA